jgi:Peptidyl-tRNA hydrolase PTH2
MLSIKISCFFIWGSDALSASSNSTPAISSFAFYLLIKQTRHHVYFFGIILLRDLTPAKIYDVGKTQLEPSTFTALDIGPASEYKIDPLIKHLKLS